MSRSIGFIAIALGALVTAPAWACRGNTQVPNHGEAAGYEVLAIEITGVHLTSYERYRASTLKIQPLPEALNHAEWVYPTSSTPDFKVHVLVHDSTVASGAPLREFSLGGCGVRVPGMKEHGLLFVRPGGSVGVVWADRDAEYQSWLRELGLAMRSEP